MITHDMKSRSKHMEDSAVALEANVEGIYVGNVG